MAILGWIVFWLMILFSIVGISYRVGKDAGIEAEQKNHNRIIWQDSEEYYLNQRNK